MRIRDLGEDAQSYHNDESTEYSPTGSQTDIFNKINRSATVSSAGDAPKVTAEASGSKIRSLLSNMRNNDEL